MIVFCSRLENHNVSNFSNKFINNQYELKTMHELLLFDKNE